MEKIKDFFYYVGDFLICILILSLMYFLISWKLQSSIPIDSDVNDIPVAAKTDNTNNSNSSNQVSNGQTENTDNNSSGDDLNKNNIDSNIDANDNKNDVEENDLNINVDADNQENNQNSNHTSSSFEQLNKNNSDNSNNEDVTFIVESGMNGYSIAAMLKDQGLIESSEEFISKLETMGLSANLLTGSFTLKKGMSYENIIKILTGTDVF